MLKKPHVIIAVIAVGLITFFLLFNFPKPLVDLLSPSYNIDQGPDGTRIAKIEAKQLLRTIKTSTAKAKLVNIWATWCGPCRTEFPHLVYLQKKLKDKGLEVLLVSADGVSALADVHLFLSANDVDFLTFIKQQDDMSFINTLYPEWSGALPATIIYDANGDAKAFWQGEASLKEFEHEIKKVMSGEQK